MLGCFEVILGTTHAVIAELIGVMIAIEITLKKRVAKNEVGVWFSTSNCGLKNKRCNCLQVTWFMSFLYYHF